MTHSTTAVAPAPRGATDPREVFADRLIEDATRALELMSVQLGLVLGLYGALAERAATGAELAERAGIAARYAREWLEQQATAGYLHCPNPGDAAELRRFELPAAHAEVLLAHESPYFVAPTAPMIAGVAGVLPELATAYRTGGGVPFSAYGAEIRHGIRDLNGALFHHELADWLTAVPDVDARLRTEPGTRILDLGCGCGRSTTALATTYPHASVHGVDLDAASIEEARAAAVAAGLADRVRYTAADAAALAETDAYQLITLFETLHDMGDPVGTLRAARRALTADGAVLIGDDRVEDELTTPGPVLERFQFGCSVLHCLPATMAENPVEANGTMLRTPTLLRWAREAGFTEARVLPIENAFWRFFLLRP
ncbi:methyltransferase domain-containing protein [Nocardia otitidiscaviarum]|uniref:Methyltransferase domain-containing protein n=1 Tax=Nocardia otitidiscaviarum TaxID=1823 RepID=A0A516NM53_9NOCA|nr:class I SAM-dependent methyltransferase [Nocardia otitidiscaviarum]MCP9624874.1 class I SAM-dependent methyltransferase [Nocardia otitidiscaviarum]QDP79984.1 methyltransferase domain-containing protein [Nocardia otitidiscaviarum]